MSSTAGTYRPPKAPLMMNERLDAEAQFLHDRVMAIYGRPFTLLITRGGVVTYVSRLGVREFRVALARWDRAYKATGAFTTNLPFDISMATIYSIVAVLPHDDEVAWALVIGDDQRELYFAKGDRPYWVTRGWAGGAPVWTTHVFTAKGKILFPDIPGHFRAENRHTIRVSTSLVPEWPRYLRTTQKEHP